jgi:hypothetical protein
MLAGLGGWVIMGILDDLNPEATLRAPVDAGIEVEPSEADWSQDYVALDAPASAPPHDR